MTQWPDDPELSRLYREMPEATPSPHLKARVLAVAEEHATTIRQRQAGGRKATDRFAWIARFFHGWQLPMGVAASLMVSVIAALMLRTAPESQQVVLAEKEIPAAAPSTPETTEAAESPSPRIRMAEVEPARRTFRTPANNDHPDMQQPAIQADENEMPTAQASGGFSGEMSKSMPKGIAPDAVKQPEAWLDEIRALQQHGQQAQARKKLREFRRQYPDYTLPDDLKLLAVRGLQ